MKTTNNNQTHKIAIIKDRVIDRYDSDGYNYDTKIIDSITEWTIVSDEVYDKLYKAQHRLGFTIIEQPLNTEKFIAKSVADYEKLIEKEAAQQAKIKAEKEEKARQRLAKKAEKSQKEKVALFKKLQQELGNEDLIGDL